AVFISELCPAFLRQPLVFFTELLAAIPSIVYGLWGVFVLVPAVRSLEVSMPDALRQVALFSGPPLGLGMLSAALILAVMVIPFSASVSREVLKSVPAAQREGAYALGATRFEAIRADTFCGRHAERRAVDCHRVVRLRRGGAAVQTVQCAGGRLRARRHDDSDHRAHDGG